MNFNQHSPRLDGTHAFLSASNYHWINYTEDKLRETYFNMMAKERGTRLHAYAAESIRLGIKLPKNRSTLNAYVNDAIGYRMTPEQLLYYSDNAYGTADAIGFRDGFLRIHDLKTGIVQASMSQLYVYDALFCLEYKYKPDEITIENRIYQNKDILVAIPDPNDIFRIMDTIVKFDKIIETMKLGG